MRQMVAERSLSATRARMIILNEASFLPMSDMPIKNNGTEVGYVSLNDTFLLSL